MAVTAGKRASGSPTFGDVVAVIREYLREFLGEIVLPRPIIPRPSKQAALTALAGSVLALVVSEAFLVTALGRPVLILPTLGVVISGVAAWFAAPDVAPQVTAAREAELRAELEALADSRVALVIRQFEWAVNDVEKMRQAVRRADAARTVAEKKTAEVEVRARQFRQMVEQAQTQLAKYEAEPLRVPAATPTPAPARTLALRWGLRDDGTMRWLRLESDDTATQRVRLLDAVDRVVTLSDPARPASPRSDGPVGVALEMSVPPAIIAELASGGLASHRFEALVGDEWRAVALADSGLRTRSTKHKRSRYHAAEAARSIA